MTKIKVLILSLALAFIIPVTQTGCKNPDRTAYSVVAVSYTTVDAAMSAWGAYVAQFHPGVQTEQKVKQAYDSYQAAAYAAADAGAAYARARATGANESEAKAAFDTALAVSASAIANLTSVLSQFGIHLSL